MENLRQKLTNRISSQDELIVVSSEERSQQANRLRAFDRAEALIVSAARLPKRRKPTAPSKASQERRLAKKRMRGLLKNNRQTRPFSD
jgi:ribosome-associated protein